MIVNVCFKRQVRLFGNVLAPQSICMDNPEDAKHWRVKVYDGGLDGLLLEATDANPMRQKMNLIRRGWFIPMSEVDSIMAEQPFRGLGGLLADVSDGGEAFARDTFADPTPVPEPAPVAVPLAKDPEVVVAHPGFQHKVNGKPVGKKK